jgi:hypothetical protein
MSRIRSIHPGLWTDEAFVTLSPMARLFLMGIWNECDDNGSFAWSPLGLKMRILPADAVDAAALLAEIVGAGIVLRYEVAGKAYGAVRNFCQFQRPKKPNAVHPQTGEVVEWVNLIAREKRESVELVGNQLPTDGEIPPQMEDGGDNKEEERSEAKASSRRAWVRPDGVSPQVWADLLDNRQRKKLGFSATARKHFQDGLARVSSQTGIPPPQLIEQCAAKGWGAIYDPRDQRNERSSNPLYDAVSRIVANG